MPDYDFRAPRLFVEAPLAVDVPIEPTATQTNYLLNVLRLSEGDDVLLFDGRSGEWRAGVKAAGRKKITLTPHDRVREQTDAPDLVYLFAPLKHARLDYMVQKATEMGVGVLQPVISQHTQGARFNVERCRANAIEAAEQCGILTVPQCRPPLKLRDLLTEWEPTRRIVFCDERAVDEDPLARLRTLAGEKLALLIGPEGGFSTEERERLMAMEICLPISLGPRILRADTAAVAALAVVQAAVGDWRGVNDV